jgi:recombination protein RecT
MGSNQLTVTDKTIGGYLQGVQANLSGYNQRGNMDELIRSAMLMISESDQLRECLKTENGKNSLYHGLKFAAATGLSLNPQEGKAALIAYNGKVQYQVMKNGLVELAMQSGKVAFITSDTVRENDTFDISKTMEGDKYSYSPARKNRGEIDGFFAAVKLKDGTCHVKYMEKSEIDAHRDKYSAIFKAKPQASPWSKSYEGMGLKTVIKAMFRSLAISPEIDKAVGTDDQEEVREMKIVSEPGFASSDIKEKIEAADTKPEPKKQPEAKQKSGDLF